MKITECVLKPSRVLILCALALSFATLPSQAATMSRAPSKPGLGCEVLLTEKHNSYFDAFAMLQSSLDETENPKRATLMPNLTPEVLAAFGLSQLDDAGLQNIYVKTHFADDVERVSPQNLNKRLMGRDHPGNEIEIYIPGLRAEEDDLRAIIAFDREQLMIWRGAGSATTGLELAVGGEVYGLIAEKSEIGFFMTNTLPGHPRRYLSVKSFENRQLSITMGIDIACEQLVDFIEPGSSVAAQQIFTVNGLVCRLPVLKMNRLQMRP